MFWFPIFGEKIEFSFSISQAFVISLISSLFLNFYFSLSNSTVSIKEFSKDIDGRVRKVKAMRKIN